jgi:hypothetical protein
MRATVKQGMNYIFFADDNFIGNRKFAKEILRAIIEFNKTTDLSMQYMTQVSIDLAKDDELLELMYEAHFGMLFIGVESPRKESLKEAHKGQNVRSDLVSDIHKIQSYNIDVSAGMIVGFDSDDTDIFREQFDFIMESNICWAMVGLLQAVPKTPLWERLLKENRIDISSLATANTSLEGNIIPKNISREELVAGYYWLGRQLYSYDNFARRVIGTLRRYSRKPLIKGSTPTTDQMNLFFNTLRYYLLTFNLRRWTFFIKIFAYVLLHKPFTFGNAIGQIVIFIHLHAFFYDYLGRIFDEKVAGVERSATDSGQSLASAYEKIRERSER